MTMSTKTLVPWHTGHLLGFDLESTGVDIEHDRVVTASIVQIVPTRDKPGTVTHEWLTNPGIPIPDEAAAIHGVTTERARTEGRPPAPVLSEVVTYLADALADGTPIVGMNIVYDFTLLDRDCRRHGVTPIIDRVDQVAPVIDIRVLDKVVDRYRRGGAQANRPLRPLRGPHRHRPRVHLRRVRRAQGGVDDRAPVPAIADRPDGVARLPGAVGCGADGGFRGVPASAGQSVGRRGRDVADPTPQGRR